MNYSVAVFIHCLIIIIWIIMSILIGYYGHQFAKSKSLYKSNLQMFTPRLRMKIINPFNNERQTMKPLSDRSDDSDSTAERLVEMQALHSVNQADDNSDGI